MYKIIILGQYGQVASRVYDNLSNYANVIRTNSHNIDFSNIKKLKEFITKCKPDIVINCAAYTNVAKAEIEPEKAFNINTKAVKLLSDLANELNFLLFHYSTDYVFDGHSQNAYKESDIVNPINIYGKTKAEADEYIIKNCQKYIILRCSAIFDSIGYNFFKTILYLAGKERTIEVVSDQITSPISAISIAKATTALILQVLINKEYGVYNICSKEEISWYDFAVSILSHASKNNVLLLCKAEDIVPITYKQYSQKNDTAKVKRPLFSKLDTTKIESIFNIDIYSYNFYFPKLINELKEIKFFQKALYD